MAVYPPKILIEQPPDSGTWVEIDPHNVALPLEISMGRSGTTLQPDAPVATFEWLDPDPPFQLGTVVSITLDLPIHVDTEVPWSDTATYWATGLTTWTGEPIGVVDRFKGYVTELVAQEDDRVIYGWKVVCTGVAAILGQTPIRISLPAQTDIERAEAIAAAAGTPIVILGSDPVNLIARNYDTDALNALQDLCNSSGGLVVQYRDGTIAYGTRNHRDINATRQFDSAVILDGVEWYQNVSDLLNHIVVRFGYTPPQPGPHVWTHDPSQTMADPGSGQYRATELEPRQLAISRYDKDGTDLYAYMVKFEDSDYAYVQERTNSENAATFVITQIVNNGSWFLMDLDVNSEQGAGVGNNRDVVFNWVMQTTKTQNTYQDPSSISEWGFRHAEIETDLAEETDANEMGNTVLVRRANPYWVMPGIFLNSDDMSTPEYRMANELQIGMGLLLEIPVAPAPIGAVESWTVEGWVEKWEYHDQQLMQVSTSDRQRWGSYALRRWSNTATHPWSYFLPMTWLEAITEQYEDGPL